MVSSGLLRRVALVRTDVSEEPGASFIRTTQKTPFFIVTAVKTSNLTTANKH
jgi:phosphatidate phosphatase APP1